MYESGHIQRLSASAYSASSRPFLLMSIYVVRAALSVSSASDFWIFLLSLSVSLYLISFQVTIIVVIVAIDSPL